MLVEWFQWVKHIAPVHKAYCVSNCVSYEKMIQKRRMSAREKEMSTDIFFDSRQWGNLFSWDLLT